MALNFPENPSNGQTHTENGITWVYDTTSTTWNLYFGAKDGRTRIASVKDVKGNTEPGGPINANTWTTRDLNTISDPATIGVSVSSDSSGFGNYITIPAGTYKITWKAPGWRLYTFQTKLEYSIDSTFATGVTKVIGSSEYSSNQDTNKVAQSSSEGLLASVTFTQETHVRIRQWAAVEGPTSPNNGLGVASYNDVTNTSSDESSIYTVVEIEDLATAVKDNATYVEGVSRVALLKDQKNYNVKGGKFLADGWRDRDLTVEEDPNNFVDFTAGGTQTDPSNGDTPGYWSLPAGTYKIEWSANAFDSNRHKSRLVWSNTKEEISTAGLHANIVTAGNIVEGSTENTTNDSIGNNDPVSTYSNGYAFIDISNPTWFKILHWCTTTVSTDGTPTFGGFGFGMSSGSGNDTGPEIYTQVRIIDLATAVKEPSTGNTKVAIVKDQKNKGIQGGNFVEDGWRDRDLTVKDDPFSFVTLYPSVRSNGTDPKATISLGDTPGYFSLPAGKYKITFSAVAHDVGRNTAAIIWDVNESVINKVYDFTTDASQLDGHFYGTSMACAGASTLSKGSEVVEISETSFFKVIHYCKSTNNGSGFGQATDIGDPDKETYLLIEIEDLKTAVKEGGSGGGGGASALNDLTDVNAGSPTDNQALSWDDASSKWIPQTISGGSGDTLPTRSPKSATAGSIASGASTDLDIAVHKAYHLLKIAVNFPAWVVIYTSDAARQADDSRAEGTDPLPGSGVIAEVSGSGTFVMSPGVFGWSDEPTPSTTIPLKVKNKDSQARAIMVELTVIQAEGPVL